MKALLFVGFLTIFTSHIALGLTIKKVFWFDLKLNKILAFFLVAVIPLIFYFLGINNFLRIISFLGGVLMGIDGILITLMFKKIDKKRSFIKNIFLGILVLIFIFGIIYQIVFG